MLFRNDRNATKLHGRKARSTMAALILTLTCMLGLTGRASSSMAPNPSGQAPAQKAFQARRTVRVFVDGKEVQGDGLKAQQNKSGRRTTTAKWKDDHGGGTISARDIELTDDSKDVKSIAKDGYLVIDETRDGIRRRLRIEPASDGKLKRTYSVRGVVQEMDDEGQAWLSRILHDFLDSSR